MILVNPESKNLWKRHTYRYAAWDTYVCVYRYEQSKIFLKEKCPFRLVDRALVFLGWCMCAKSPWLCPTLRSPRDCSPPGSSVQGILQIRILEWVATFCSRGSSWPRDGNGVTYVSCIGRQILYHCAIWLQHTIENIWLGNSLAVQWLGLCSFTVEGPSLIPCQEVKIPWTARHPKRKEHIWLHFLPQKFLLHKAFLFFVMVTS